MSIKSKVIEAESEKYPVLKQDGNNGKIVLFTGKGTGCVVNLSKSSSFYLGEYAEDFQEGCYEYFHGKVELSNKRD